MNLILLKIYDQRVFEEHRSGWGYAISSLASLNSPDGLRFDGFLEETFGWSVEENIQIGLVPYTEPWVGFVHNPVEQPAALDLTPVRDILTHPAFIDSLEHCRGLFCLSESMAKKEI